jgi:hypothetical protein
MGCQGSKVVQPSMPPKKTLLTEEKKQVGQSSPPSDSVGVTVAPPTTQVQDNPSSPDTNSAAVTDSASAYRTIFGEQHTRCIDRTELELMVMRFSCHDGTAGENTEGNCEEIQWIVGYDRKAAPIDIKVQVQQGLHANDVRIESEGKPIFPSAGEHAKAKLLENICYHWPFRARIHGISEHHFFEFHAPNPMCDTWLPATVLDQRDDGLFDVSVQEPNASGQLMEVKHHAVDKTRLRETSTGKPVIVPEAALMLEVPKQDPLGATLKVANGERVSLSFGRPHEREIRFQVDKDRKTVTADVGHGILANFASGDVQSIKSDAERLCHTWAFQLGPFAEHIVEISKTDTLDNNVITLLVDGEVMVKAKPANIGCIDSDWQFDFRFVGECVMDFEVLETNLDGTSSDVTEHVKEIRRYVHECKVLLPKDMDCSSAELLIDGMSLTELPVKATAMDEQTLVTDPLTLQHKYGITLPCKIDDNGQCDLIERTGAGNGLGNRFADFMCCAASSAVKDEIVVH